MEAKHFIFPFLAHALGTLVGGLVASLIAKTSHMKLALLVGVIFLAAGTYNVVTLPAPIWFEALDLIAAYLPMAWIGYRLSGK